MGGRAGMNRKKRMGGRPRHHPAVRTAFGDWMESSGMPPLEVAKTLGIGLSTVYALKNGEFPPGAELRLEIEQLTGGLVSFRSW